MADFKGYIFFDVVFREKIARDKHVVFVVHFHDVLVVGCTGIRDKSRRIQLDSTIKIEGNLEIGIADEGRWRRERNPNLIGDLHLGAVRARNRVEVRVIGHECQGKTTVRVVQNARHVRQGGGKAGICHETRQEPAVSGRKPKAIRHFARDVGSQVVEVEGSARAEIAVIPGKNLDGHDLGGRFTRLPGPVQGQTAGDGKDKGPYMEAGFQDDITWFYNY
jgi:hypothetical protein